MAKKLSDVFNITNDPAKDPTHPQTTLPPRQAGDVFLRLVRAYGFSKGMRLYGLFQVVMSDSSEFEKVRQGVMARHRNLLYQDLEALKAVNLAPDALYPSEMIDWLDSWVKAGYDIGRLTAEAVYQFRSDRNSGDKLPQT